MQHDNDPSLGIANIIFKYQIVLPLFLRPKMECIFCQKDSICGCHNDEPIFSTELEHPQYNIGSDKEFEDLLDELDSE